MDVVRRCLHMQKLHEAGWVGVCNLLSYASWSVPLLLEVLQWCGHLLYLDAACTAALGAGGELHETTMLHLQDLVRDMSFAGTPM